MCIGCHKVKSFIIFEHAHMQEILNFVEFSVYVLTEVTMMTHSARQSCQRL